MIFGPGVDVNTNTAALSHALAIGTWLRIADHVPVQNLQPMSGFIAEGLRHAITNIALDTQNSERVYKPSPFKINPQRWPQQLNINDFYTAHILTTTAIKEALRSISYHKSRVDEPWANTGMDAELSRQDSALQQIVDTADYSLTHDSLAIRANGGMAATEDMAIPAQLREQAISDASYELER